MASSSFPVTAAHSIGLFVESILYGIHLVTAGFSVKVLTSRSRRWRWNGMRKINWPMIMVTLSLLTFATIAISINLYWNLRALVFLMPTETSTEVFLDLPQWANLTLTTLLILETLIGDAMLVYRCWVIFNRSWKVIVLPGLLWFSVFLFGILLDISKVTTPPNTSELNNKLVVQSSMGFWCSSVVLNIITTGILIWRIWSVERTTKRYMPQDGRSSSIDSYTILSRVMRIILESGFIYTAVAFSIFVLISIGNNSAYVVLEAESHIIGIAFNMIIIRAAILSRDRNHTQQTSSHRQTLHVFVSSTTSNTSNVVFSK